MIEECLAHLVSREKLHRLHHLVDLEIKEMPVYLEDRVRPVQLVFRALKE